MDNKVPKYYVDWWNIRKTTIYWIVAIVLAAGLIFGGYWFASRYNWFAADEKSDVPKDAARIVSFEGDVRI